MTTINKGIRTARSNGNLGRKAPNKDGVALFVMNGIAVGGGAQLGVLYNINDLAALKIDAAYDLDNKVLVHQHITDALTYNPSLEGYFFLCPQKVLTVDQTPDILCDKTEDYLQKALTDAKTAGHVIKLVAIAFNPGADYAPNITAGIDSTGGLAKAKLNETLELWADLDCRMVGLLEARSFSGTVSALVNVEEMASNLNAPRVSFVIAADPATSILHNNAPGYAAVGAAIGMLSLSAISENMGNPIAKFNVTNVAKGLFLTHGLSGLVALPTDATNINLLDAKGYIFISPVAMTDGLYFNDTRTCVPITDDYAYIENNRCIDKVIDRAKAALTPLVINARLQVDPTSGEMTLVQKTLLEGTSDTAIETMVADGDLSGGVQTIIPAGVNVLSGETIPLNISCVPLAIGRSVLITAGLSNPFNN